MAVVGAIAKAVNYPGEVADAELEVGAATDAGAGADADGGAVVVVVKAVN